MIYLLKGGTNIHADLTAKMPQFVWHLSSETKMHSAKNSVRILSFIIALVVALFCSQQTVIALSPEPAATGTVVRHYVAFKFKDGTASEKIEQIVAAFKHLQTEVPDVLSIEEGVNVSPEHMNKGLTHGFIVSFPTLNARDVYLLHPNHLRFVDLVRPELADSFILDFACDAPEKLTTGIPTNGQNNQIVDLTHVLGPDLPDFHEGSVAFTYDSIYTVKKDGYAGGKFCTPEHYGTHIDAPSHFIDEGASVDQISADSLIRPCVVIDVRDEVKQNSDYQLTVDKIKSFETGGKIPPGSIVLLLTGWEDRWSSPKEYRNADATGTMRFPSFSPEAAAYLADRSVAALGVDTISADYGLSKTYGVHHLALSKGIFLIENLNNLDKLPARNALLFCGVLPIKNGTGAPARILAVVPKP